jgi:predicted HNH restriction endonuclease
MQDILQTLSAYDLGSVLIIGTCAILGVVKLIESVKNTWKKRQEFKEQGIQEGIAKERKHEAKERQQEEEDRRISALEKTCSDLLSIVKAQ